jgi:hypothetical protein
MILALSPPCIRYGAPYRDDVGGRRTARRPGRGHLSARVLAGSRAVPEPVPQFRGAFFLTGHPRAFLSRRKGPELATLANLSLALTGPR